VTSPIAEAIAAAKQIAAAEAASSDHKGEISAGEINRVIQSAGVDAPRRSEEIAAISDAISAATSEVELAPEPAEVEAEIETVVVGKEHLSDYVGKPVYQNERFYATNPPGVVTGLAWTSMGGAMLYVEMQPLGPPAPTAARRQRKGGDGAAEGGDDEEEGGGGGGGASLRHTGQMGDVMRESTAIAHTFARSFLHRLDPTNAYLERQSLHVHVPEGATPKDGPSAGVTMVTAMLSLARDKPTRADLAMTGELSLTGRVLPIGGVKEKTIAAQRAGIRHIVFPKANKRDYDELPDNLREGITAHFAERYEEVYEIAFAEDD